jgi:hypothetical protein
MDILARWLFPNQPRLVRLHKVRIIGFAIAFCLVACLILGSLLLIINSRIAVSPQPPTIPLRAHSR